MVDWTRWDGTTIPSGEAITPGAFEATSVNQPTLTSVSADDQKNTISFSTVPGASSYNLYWKTSSGVTISDTKITGVTSPHNHTSLSNGTTYYYVATAVVDSVETDISNELYGTPFVPTPPLMMLYAIA